MHRVLVANRGEIACRIIRAAQQLGIETCAVFSDADVGAPHTELATISAYIGDSPALQSYLRIDKLIEVALENGCDSVHPGYGFLSESSEFARKVLEHQLLWIGPSPECIDAMGDKAQARRLAKNLGIDLLEGSDPIDDEVSAEQIYALGERVGYPLLVKAAAGGGGIGMKLVQSRESLLATVESTQTMAARTFGSSVVYLERYLRHARHIEIQIFGFGDGRVVHLFERDCSIQRRYQKIIEEAPAVGLLQPTLDALCQAAVTLAESQNYSGVGTVEFIVDGDTGDGFFLEMNTRIQVEHPVTEMITGIDLVGIQLRHAYRMPLPIILMKPEQQGCAIECRVYAENPKKRFIPSPGYLERCEFPPASGSVRIDTGVREGMTITPYYDPMIAKLITKGVTREAAVEHMITALRCTQIQGVSTNIEYLIQILEDDRYQRGLVHTGFIDEFNQSVVIT